MIQLNRILSADHASNFTAGPLDELTILFQENYYVLTQAEIEEKAALDSLQYGPYGLCFYFYATQGEMPPSCREEGLNFLIPNE